MLSRAKLSHFGHSCGETWHRYTSVSKVSIQIIHRLWYNCEKRKDIDMEKLEFETKNLSYVEIEDKVTSFYDIGYPDSSNFMELKIGVHSNYYIMASKGSIEFSAIVGRKENDEGYLVTIKPIKLKKDK